MGTQRWTRFSPLDPWQSVVEVPQRDSECDVSKGEAAPMTELARAKVLLHRRQACIDLFLMLQVPVGALPLCLWKSLVMGDRDSCVSDAVAKCFPALNLNPIRERFRYQLGGAA